MSKADYKSWFRFGTLTVMCPLYFVVLPESGRRSVNMNEMLLPDTLLKRESSFCRLQWHATAEVCSSIYIWLVKSSTHIFTCNLQEQQ